MEKKQELLDLKSDWVFKRIFAKEGNEDILADLLSAILGIEIKKIELRNTELTKNKEEQKKSILDIKAELNDTSIVDIEMQVKDEANMVDRNMQYATKMYSEQLEEGEDYTNAKQVIVINILDYNLCKRNTYHSVAHLKFEEYPKETYVPMYEKEDETLTKKLEIHIIELKKFLKMKNIEDNKLVEWLQLISGEREMIEMALSKNAQKIKKAYEELQYLSQDKQARQEFDEYKQIKMDERAKISYAEEKGIAKGIERGIAKGKTIGEKNKSIEIAKEMLKLNISIETIIQVTKLTEEEIKNLK